MKRALFAIAIAATVTACGPWVGADSERAVVSGESVRVNYMTAAPGVYDMRAFRMRWSEGLALEEKQFSIDATRQVAAKVCPNGADLDAVERVGGPALYETRWRCR